MNTSIPLDNPIDYYRVGKLEGKQEILDKLEKLISRHWENIGNRVIGQHLYIESESLTEFIEENSSPSEGGE